MDRDCDRGDCDRNSDAGPDYCAFPDYMDVERERKYRESDLYFYFDPDGPGFPIVVIPVSVAAYNLASYGLSWVYPAVTERYHQVLEYMQPVQTLIDTLFR